MSSRARLSERIAPGLTSRLKGDSVSLTFNGTAIYLFGAKRGNHGQYGGESFWKTMDECGSEADLTSVSLDSGALVTQSGYSADNLLQQVMYSETGLDPNKEHNVHITAFANESSVPGVNNTQWWFDLDYAIITTSTYVHFSTGHMITLPLLTLLRSEGQVYTTKLDDTSPVVQYGSPSSWSGGPLSPQTYYNTTAHISNFQGAAFSLK